jgi:hypothetical protein
MPIYTITTKDRYKVQADTPEQALASYRVRFDGIEPEIYEMTIETIVDQDAFEYLDGQVKVREDN